MARRGEKPQKAAMNIIKRNRGGSKSQKGKKFTLAQAFSTRSLPWTLEIRPLPMGGGCGRSSARGVISRGLSMRRSGRRWLFHVDHMVITAPCIVLRRAVVVTSAKLFMPFYCLFMTLSLAGPPPTSSPTLRTAPPRHTPTFHHLLFRLCFGVCVCVFLDKRIFVSTACACELPELLDSATQEQEKKMDSCRKKYKCICF